MNVMVIDGDKVEINGGCESCIYCEKIWGYLCCKVLDMVFKESDNFYCSKRKGEK